MGRAPEHGHQARGDDALLTGVEHAQGALAGQGGAAVALQVLVIAASLKGFVVEVFDGLVIEQRVDGAGVGGRIQLIHAAAELGAPCGHADRECDVDHQSDQRDPGEPDIKFDGQQSEHQHQLNQRGHDAVERIRHQRMHGAGAALDVAGHAASLALQVKAQTHAVQVPEYLQRDAARCPFGGLGKHQVAQLGE